MRQRLTKVIFSANFGLVSHVRVRRIEQVAVHAPPHLDEFVRLVIRRLFGGVALDFVRVQWLFVTDGGRNLPEDFRELAAKGEALAVGIGGNLSGDDEHGTEHASAASLPLKDLRANFDRTMSAAGVSRQFLDEYWNRFQGFVTFCEIRDSSASGAPFDLATIFKRLIGYRAIFERGPSSEKPIVRGKWTREQMLDGLYLTQAALVGITCLPHRPIEKWAWKRMEGWLIGWVLRNLNWQGKPQERFEGSLKELFETVNRRTDALAHQQFRFLMGHLHEMLDEPGTWSADVRMRKILRRTPRYDGRRPECPETLLNLVQMFMRREWREGDEPRDNFIQRLTPEMKHILRLEPGFARQFLYNILDAWDHDQWLYAREAAYNEQVPGAVAFRESESHELAVVYSRGPHLPTRVRARQDHRVTMMLAFNTTLNTVMVSMNRGARQERGVKVPVLNTAARNAGMDPLAYADLLTRWWVALLRACELKLDGREIPTNEWSGPAECLFADGALPESITPTPRWYAASNDENHVHTVMSGSISHPDAPKTRLLGSEGVRIPDPDAPMTERSERMLIALSVAVQDAASAERQKEAFHEMFRKIVDAPDLQTALLHFLD